MNVYLEYLGKPTFDEHELEPTAGVAYRVMRGVHLGAEARLELIFEGDVVDGPYLWAGPTVHLAGEGGKLGWTLSVLFPATGETIEHTGPIGRSLVALNS